MLYYFPKELRVNIHILQLLFRQERIIREQDIPKHSNLIRSYVIVRRHFVLFSEGVTTEYTYFAIAFPSGTNYL